MTISRRAFLLRSTTASLAAVALPRWLAAEEADPEKSGAVLVTSKAHAAIESGLAFLASRQQQDGAFGAGGYSRNVAVAGLCGLAFMSGGSTPGRGPYGREVARAVRFIMDNTEESGFIVEPQATSHGPMYGHGFATMFLAECYGMSRGREVRTKLNKAVKLIVSTQNREGGWRYQPQPSEADVSVTVCQIMALRAARNAGIYVPNETIERCIDYVKQCQNPDGGFRYMLQGGQSQFARSAAGVVALQSAGIYDAPEVKRGVKYLFDFLPRLRQIHESHYFYGHYYAVQAMWHAGGHHWASWYPSVRDELVTLQRPNGSWMDSICQEYGTAMACLVLQVPNNMLPIFQR